jgi:hypothetical protein
MVTSLSFNISTKKYLALTLPSATVYAKIYDPAGNFILDKRFNPLIDNSNFSDTYNLPINTSGDVVQGTYSYYYGTDNALRNTLSIVTTLPTVGQVGITYLVFDEMETSSITRYDAYFWSVGEEESEYVGYDPVYYAAVNYLGSTAPCLEFNVTNDCNFYPTGQIVATDTTNYGDYNIDNRSIQLYYPNGLSPAPVSPYVETTSAASLVVNTLATGLWTAVLTSSVNIIQDDGLYLYYTLKKTLTSNVVCNSQLCSVNDALDQITSAYAADVACGSTTPRYAQELTLANAYYSQYQIERSCGDTLAAASYAEKLTALVGQSSSSCSGSCGCSGSNCGCDTSCGCSGHDNAPQWVNNTTSEAGYISYVALMSQSGTNDPNAIVLENSLGDINWQYDGGGSYEGYLYNAFPSGKTFIRISLSNNTSEIVTAYRYNDSYVYITTGETNGILNNNAFEIRVYN